MMCLDATHAGRDKIQIPMLCIELSIDEVISKLLVIVQHGSVVNSLGQMAAIEDRSCGDELKLRGDASLGLIGTS